MSRFRFSIAGFFLVVTLVAFGLAASVSQSEMAGSAAFTVFLGLLCLATAGAILRPLPARAFWLGFALFGWTYWMCEFESELPTPQRGFVGSLLFNGSSSANSASNRPSLVTRHLIQLMADSLTPSRSVGAKVMGQWRRGSYYSGTISQANGSQYLIIWDDGSAPQWTPTTQIMPNSPSVLVAGHSLCGGLFALIGGALAAILFGASSSDRKGPATGSGTD